MAGYKQTYWASIVLLTLASCAFDTSTSATANQRFDGGGQVDAASADVDSSLDGSLSTFDADVDAGLGKPPLGTLRSTRITDSIVDIESIDWTNADYVSFDKDSAAQVDNINGSNFAASLRVASQYNDDFLFFWVEVTDGEIFTGNPLFEHDSVELFLGKKPGNGPFAPTQHYLLFGLPDSFRNYYHQNQDTPDGFINATATGYTVLFSFSRDQLADNSGNATTYGFNIALNDQTSSSFGNALWFLPNEPSTCSNCCQGIPSTAWCDSSRFGTLELIP